MRQITKL